MKSINPATDELIWQFEELDASGVEQKIQKCQSSFEIWRDLSFSERSVPMKKLATLLREQKDDLAKLMALEMGKPISDGAKEIEKCASVCEYYATEAESILADQIVKTEASKSYVSAKPLGVILAIMPWNFPFWQAFRFIAPTLMAGNGALLKHASNVMACAERIERLLLDSGFIEGLFQNLILGSSRVEAVIRHRLVKAVSLTGSTPAGKSVAAIAGSCLKKAVLELGGSDPYIVLADADLDLAVEQCVRGRLINNGQSCIAAKRFIVVEEVYDPFLDKMSRVLGEYQFGDPLKESTQLGPMARKDLRDSLHSQVIQSVQKGARLHFGGEIPEGPGAYYPVTLLSEVTPGMAAFDEELFGPVAALIRAKDDEEAIRLANQSCFGLGAAVFTQNRQKGEQIARDRFEAGSCFVNGFVRSDPRLPFGGIKESGYGRELGAWGIHEFVSHKTLYIAE